MTSSTFVRSDGADPTPSLPAHCMTNPTPTSPQLPTPPSDGILTEKEWLAFLSAPSWDASETVNRYEGVRFLMDLGREIPAYRHKAGAVCLLGLFTHEMVRSIVKCAIQAPDQGAARSALEAAGTILSILPPQHLPPSGTSPTVGQVGSEQTGTQGSSLSDVLDCLDLAIVALDAGEVDTALEWLARFSAQDESPQLLALMVDPLETVQQATRYLTPQPNLAANQLRRVRMELEKAVKGA